MNPGAVIVLWILVGVTVGWLASKILGAARGSALANVGIGILGALLGGCVTMGVLAKLGYDGRGIAGIGGALFGSCALVFGSHGFSYGKA
jgi:uncharacterized membrane protein YeaQ/YmgE (transglycosylase-associated protein family)